MTQPTIQPTESDTITFAAAVREAAPGRRAEDERDAEGLTGVDFTAAVREAAPGRTATT